MIDALPIVVVPLAAGILVLATHVPLGQQVLQRGVVFIDLAIAQIAALGVLMAGAVTDHPLAAGVAGALAALAGAGLIAWLSDRHPRLREALIGLVYVSAAVIAVLWMSADAHGAQQLAAMLSGDVLWVTWTRLLPLAVVSVPFLALHASRHRHWTTGRGFYCWFAVLVSLSVPLLGLYLVFATLIVPAVARSALPGLSWGAAVGASTLAYAAGLLASVAWDLPSGPCVVLALVGVGLGCVFSGR